MMDTEVVEDGDFIEVMAVLLDVPDDPCQGLQTKLVDVLISVKE